MRGSSNRALRGLISSTAVGLLAMACGGESPASSDGAQDQVGHVASALQQGCGAGTASVVNGDAVCTYTNVGTFSGANGFTPPAGVTAVQVLVVGGGGGGGEGGGGAGGVIYNASYGVVPGTPLTVTVGDGGASNNSGAPGVTNAGSNGGDSVFDSLVAKGGGGGGGYQQAGNDGGSGGGSGCDYLGTPSNGVPGQGAPGGKSNANSYGGSAGGGGATAPGADGGPTAAQPGTNPTVGGNGGDGFQSSISGTAKYYGGGGGGGVNSNSTAATAGGAGGQGGGGPGVLVPNGNANPCSNASCPNGAANSGAANTGGGGGGGDCEGYGGKGGSGIVIVRYSACTTDANCLASQWCDTGASPRECKADLANGTAMPTVPSHTSPVLDGTCTAAAAAVVCVAKSCDTSDNACGKKNGSGPCTADSECRSGVCDTAANGGAGVCRECTTTKLTNCGGSKPVCDTATGTCAACNGDFGTTATATCPQASPFCPGGGSLCTTCGAANQTTACSSANATHAGHVCTVSGACADVCSSDAQCDQTQFCDTAQQKCLPRLANGAAIPTIAGHTPALDGTCSVAVANAVCTSTVCDSADNKCGYADGDGPCSANDAARVCRSGKCGSNGKCLAAGACGSDSDCADGFCDKSANPPACVAKKAAGSPCAAATQCLSGSCSAGTCDTVCAKPADCPATSYCDLGSSPNVCRAKKADGTPCATADECTSGQCNGNKCGSASSSSSGATGSSGASGTSGSSSSSGDADGGGSSSSSGAAASSTSSSSGGGGGGCAMASTSSRGGGSAFALLAGLGLVAGAVRRRRSA